MKIKNLQIFGNDIADKLRALEGCGVDEIENLSLGGNQKAAPMVARRKSGIREPRDTTGFTDWLAQVDLKSVFPGKTMLHLGEVSEAAQQLFKRACVSPNMPIHLPKRKIGGRFYWAVADIEAWQRQHRKKHGAPADEDLLSLFTHGQDEDDAYV